MADPLPPLTDAEVHDLALRITVREVFIASDIRTIEMSFPVLRLADPEQIPPNVGGVYAPYSAASPRAINGLPMFFEAHFVPVESWEALIAELDRLRIALS